MVQQGVLNIDSDTPPRALTTVVGLVLETVVTCEHFQEDSLDGVFVVTPLPLQRPAVANSRVDHILAGRRLSIEVAPLLGEKISENFFLDPPPEPFGNDRVSLLGLPLLALLFARNPSSLLVFARLDDCLTRLLICWFDTHVHRTLLSSVWNV